MNKKQSLKAQTYNQIITKKKAKPKRKKELHFSQPTTQKKTPFFPQKDTFHENPRTEITTQNQITSPKSKHSTKTSILEKKTNNIQTSPFPSPVLQDQSQEQRIPAFGCQFAIRPRQ